MKNKRRLVWNILAPYIGILVVVLFFEIASGGKLLSTRNLKSILEQMLVTGTICFGYLFTMSMGSLDYSVGSTYGLACITVAVLSRINPWLALLGGIVVGVAFSTLVGAIFAFVKVPSSIVSMCFMFTVRGLVQFCSKSQAFTTPLAMHKMNELSLKLPIFFALFILGFFLFHYTRFGRQTKAIGCGQLAARFSGVNVERIKVLAFMFSGLCVGVAAFLGMLRAGNAGATTGNTYSLNVLLALVMGGMSIRGGASSLFIASFIGCAYMTLLTNGLVLIEVDVATQQLVKGIIFIATIAISGRDLSFLKKRHANQLTK